MDTVATPTGTQDVSTINAVRDAAVQGGQDPYALAPTNVSKAAGLGTTPTVMTDANVRENVIPGILNRANTMLPQQPVQNPTPGTPSTGGNTQTPTGDAPTGDNYYSDLYKTLSSQLDNSPETQSELTLLNNMKSNNDAASDATIQSIKDSYNTRAGTLAQANNSNERSAKNALLRSGALRYSPISSNGILSEQEKNDIQSLGDLQDKENQAVAAAQTAKSNQDYQLLGKNLDILEKVRTDKLALGKTINDSMMKENQDIRTRNQQGQRDSAVADLIQEGVTNPSELLSKLNATNPAGGAYSADEIGKTIKALSPTGDLTGLTGSVKDFYALKGKGELPGSISTMPEADQLFAYLKQIKTASSLTKSGSAPSTKKITYSEAKSVGLPISIVGSSEKDIIDSLQQDTPPDWFLEKLKSEGGDPTSSTTEDTWNTYRAKVGQPTSKTGTSATTDTSFY